MSLEKFLDYASKKYYEGAPIMSDSAFDRLSDSHGYKKVGYSTDENTVEHIYRMYSLQKVFEGDKDPETILPAPVCVTPKLDGAAISITYVDGELTLAVSRGDGFRGKDVTANVSQLDIPKKLINFASVTQVTGEIVAPASIENARNYAAGALGLKDTEEFKSRDLTFIAYDVHPHVRTTWSNEMVSLRCQGFHTVVDRDWNMFPQDGLVWRCDTNSDYERLGHTHRHPKGAFALKSRSEGVTTTLKDVKWQVGKSGVVSPVAILDPVKIGGATVTKATLHNMKYIEDLDLEIGCQVEVIRSGEIIPRVVRRVE